MDEKVARQSAEEKVVELEKLIETISNQLVTESQRFLDIDQMRVAKLEKLRKVETELEIHRRESQVAKDLLAREHELCESLADQNRDLLERIKSLSESLENERSNLKSLSDEFKSNVTEAEKSNETLIGEYELKLLNSQDIIDSLRQEIINLNGEVSRYQGEAKHSKAQLISKTAELNDQIMKLTNEMNVLNLSSSKTIKEQRAMIDQLTNSMSEAATQLMEAQSHDQVAKSDLDERNRKIESLEQHIDSLHSIIAEKDTQISQLRDHSEQLVSTITSQNHRLESMNEDNETLKKNLQKESSDLQICRSKIRAYEVSQNKFMKQMDSLPIINKRLEADCGFLRDDLKTNAEKLKQYIVENDSLASRIQAMESVLTPNQRARLSEKSGTRPRSEASVIAENKRLLVEAMELRMRLVDSQAARDKAQSTVLEQSQLLAKLQRQPTEEDDENIMPTRSVSPNKVSRSSPKKVVPEKPENRQECVQQ